MVATLEERQRRGKDSETFLQINPKADMEEVKMIIEGIDMAADKVIENIKVVVASQRSTNQDLE